MTPKEISREANRIFCGAIPCNWAIRDQQDQEDVGIDYELELTTERDQPTGLMFKVQQKGETTVSISRDKRYVTYSGMPITKLHYYLEKVPNPVVLVLVDITERRVYWTLIQGNSAVKASYTEAVSAGHSTTTLRIPKNQVLPETAEQLLSEVARVYDIMCVHQVCMMKVAHLAEVSQQVETLNPNCSAKIQHVITSATSSAEADKAKGATKWSAQHQMIRGLMNRHAIEAAQALCMLLLSDPQFEQATPDEVAKIENNLGCCLLRMGRLNEAEQRFERAQKLVPDESKYLANYLAVRSNTSPSDPDLLRQVDKLLESGPSSQLEVTKAQIIAALSGPQEAMNWISACISRTPKSPDLNFIAAMIAMRLPDYHAASEFAEAGLSAEPSDPDLCRAKADALMLQHMRENSGIMLPPIPLSEQQRTDIQQSVIWYTKAVTILSTPNDQRKFQLSEVLTQRGVAHMVLGEMESALSDFDESINNNPDDSTARFNMFTIRIRLEQSENIDSEAECLLQISQHRRHVLRSYVSFLGERGRIDDIERLAHRYSEDFKETLEPGYILALARDSNRRPYRNARLFLRGWRKSHNEASHSWLRAWAQILANMGHTARAEKVLRYSLDNSSNNASSLNAARALASLYAQQNRWEEACAAYRRFIPLSSYTPDLPSFLYAQMHAEGTAAALATITATLPLSVREHPGVLFLWAQIAESQGNVLLAARLFLRLWRKHNSEESAVHCSHCLYRLPHTRRRADTILRRVKHYDRMRAELAMLAASMLADFGHFPEAMKVGYAVAIRNQANRAVQERYAALILMQCHNKLHLQIDVVEKGCVVDVEVKGERRCWFLAPQQEDILLPNCEAINEPKILLAIKGHRVGDNFAFSGCNDEIILGVIRQVRCKELKLLHEILEHVRIRPDNESMIHAIPADIPALLVKLNEYARDNARIMSVYRERKWPLVWLAAACNRPAFDVFWAALNGQVGPLDAFPGNIHFYEKHSSIAASDTPFLLDLHALQTISCFDLMPILQLIRNRCRICQSAVDALTSAIQAIKLSQHSEQSISGDGIGGATLYTVPESERVRYRHHLSACDSFIQSLSYSQILPEPTRRELPEAAPAVLSFPIADMIEISREQSIPVLLGDMRLSGLFHPDFQFSVRAVIDLARRKNVLTAERTAAVLGEMKLAGLQYISVSEDILIASRDLLIGGQKPEAFAILFSQLSPVKSDWKTSLPIIANCISTFAITRGLDDNQRQTLVAAVLSAAFGESHQGKHLRDLVALVRAHLRLAPIQLAATLETVRIWNSMHKNSIIT